MDNTQLYGLIILVLISGYILGKWLHSKPTPSTGQN